MLIFTGILSPLKNKFPLEIKVTLKKKRAMQMDHATSYASFNTICYLLIQGNICPRFNFAPFALHVYGRIWNWANCIGLNYLFI